MNNSLKTALIVIAVLAIAAVFVMGGFFFGQRWSSNAGYRFNTNNGLWNDNTDTDGFCYGLNCTSDISGGFFGRSMMGNFSNNSTGRGYGMGQGMMGGRYGYQTASGTVLSVEEARSAFESYLDSLGNDDLEIHEIMIFDQNAYAIVVEESTGIGAMELLVDHDTQSVYPEYGPNRMWNTKYGMMGSGGCGFSGFMNCSTGLSNANASAEMTLSMDEAADIASEYLTSTKSGTELVNEGYPFYGYYTFDYMQDGQMAGMLSVNGSSGQVWPHTWHGQFIEEWELEDNH